MDNEKKKKNANCHAGHRQRVKERYLSEGLDGFAPHEVLEMLLFYSTPQRDTNPIAHNLIDEIGSFQAVLDAEIDDLKQIDGVTENSAILISLIKELYSYYLKEKQRNVFKFNSIAQIASYMRRFFVSATRERVVVLCLNAKNELISCKVMFEGSVNASAVPQREIVGYALKQNASSVLIAHNHPNGHALPSRADIVTTRNLKKLLEAVDVNFLDHLIFSEEDYVSMLESDVFGHIPTDLVFKQRDVRQFDDDMLIDEPEYPEYLEYYDYD